MSQTTEKPKDVTVGCKVNHETKEKLEKLADEKQMSVSSLVRETLEDRLREVAIPDEQ
ncbi:MAG: hypothetical protein U5J64_11085 [Halobacteriales archaeon]|nr:hypothetical protein [Halobacteriales archaeon]